MLLKGKALTYFYAQMNQKVLRYIISLMAISLMGIISFQAYWIWLKANEKALEFDKSVYKSLAQISKDIEENEASVFVQKIKKENLPVKTTQTKTVTSTTTVTDDNVTEIIISGDNDFTYVVDLNSESSKIPDFKVSGDELDSYLQSTSDLNFEFINLSDSSIHKEKELIKLYRKKKNNIETVIQKMAVELTFKNASLIERLKNIDIDSTIANNLKSEGILNTKYNFFIQDKKTDSIVIGANNILSQKADNQYATDILASGDRDEGGTLFLSFQNKTNYILRSIWLSVVISILLTLIMVFTFSYTIRSILKEKKLSRIKADFINNMTHEFKTPIATISLAIDSMLHPLVRKDEKEIERFGGIIKKENERMNRQIESVLNAARFEREDINLKEEHIDINQMISELVGDFKLKTYAQAGDIKLNLVEGQHIIVGDEMHFYNALRNLIDNGIKFSKEAFRICLKTYLKENNIVVEISDRGIGMDKETQKRAFDRFYRKSEGNLHNTKGFGLGLNYVKEIITRMRGDIKLESKLNQGTTIYIELPLVK